MIFLFPYLCLGLFTLGVVMIVLAEEKQRPSTLLWCILFWPAVWAGFAAALLRRR